MGNVRLNDYLVQMRPQVRRLASRRERNHPYLGQGDLEQEVMIVLWRLWRRWHRKLTADGLQRLGTVVMRTTVVSQYRYAYCAKRGRADQVVPLGDWEADVAETDGMVDLLVRMLQESFAIFLSADAERLLYHHVVPEPKLQRLLKRLWRTKAKYHNWPYVETTAFSTLLGWTPNRVSKAQAELRRTVRWFLGLGSPNEKR